MYSERGEELDFCPPRHDSTALRQDYLLAHGCVRRHEQAQFCFAGIALIIAVGSADCILPLSMCPGHAQFGPDREAGTLPRIFNASDVFNLFRILSCAEDCISTQLYGRSILLHWRKAIDGVFGPVDNIMQYRQFCMLSDEPDLSLGPDAVVPMLSGLTAIPGRPASIF